MLGDSKPCRASQRIGFAARQHDVEPRYSPLQHRVVAEPLRRTDIPRPQVSPRRVIVGQQINVEAAFKERLQDIDRS